MNKLVCDRCGDEAGTCYHRFDSEYSVCSQAEYQKGIRIMRLSGVGLIMLLALVVWGVCK